jgi:hypothetical protein
MSEILARMIGGCIKLYKELYVIKDLENYEAV